MTGGRGKGGSLQLVAGDIYRLLDLPAGCIFTWPGEKGGETAGAGVRQLVGKRPPG